MSETTRLYYDVFSALLLYLYDQKSVDQDTLKQLKKKFYSAYELEDETTLDFYTNSRDTRYGISYTRFDVYSVIMNMLGLMGAEVGPDLTLKYADALDSDELAYIHFISCIGISQDSSMKPQIQRAIGY